MEEPARRARHFDQAIWCTSTLCNNGACVEVAFSGDLVAVRDSKDRSGPMLRFFFGKWEAFTDGVRLGEFDLPR